MFHNNPYYNPAGISRNVVYARKGMVAASQPLVAQIGLDILKQDGNAVDAAVGMAAALSVMEPTANGIGGDAFALIWNKGKLYGINASGPAPMAISIDKVKAEGYKEMPRYGFPSVTVPGAPAAWNALVERFGYLKLTVVLKPAIYYANEGYPVSPKTALSWQSAYDNYKENLKGDEFKEWFRVFAPKGRPPKAGELWKCSDMAYTLQLIATSGGKEFYQGILADAIHNYSVNYDGYLRKEDLYNYKPEWVTPLSVHYRGYDVWEIPPNTQGLVCLMALNIIKGYKNIQPFDERSVHLQIEAMKMSFCEGFKAISDPYYMTTDTSYLLDDSFAAKIRTVITEEAFMPEDVNPSRGGTVYLATADKDGNMVSYIQSNYMGFGSGLVVPKTGIALQNRGHTFSLNPAKINCLKPGKKTYHTIIPGFLTKNGEAVGPFGVMGGFMQPQGHMQVIMNSIDFNMNPQAALDAARWQWTKGKHVKVEEHFPLNILEGLRKRGHEITVERDNTSFGRGQIIWRNGKTGVYVGGSESRTDGLIAAW